MSFRYLTPERLDGLPLILAGPILRETTASSVSVWVASRQPGVWTLSVATDDGKAVPLVPSPAATVSLGAGLHVTLATAAAAGNAPVLQPGKTYVYDLALADGRTLASPGIVTATGGASMRAAIAYGAYAGPSFALPPADLGLLRLVHGSCRKAHAPGYDALSALDELLATSFASADTRPHQLFLTGDQIYGDDVADAMLVLAREVAQVLLGYEEQLPGVADPKELVPGRRSRLATEDAHLTSTLPGTLPKNWGFSKSHLLAFGEYVAMYLLAWSDALWPDTLPTVDEVAAPDLPPAVKAKLGAYRDGVRDELAAVARFRATIPAVRRALANVPTYTIWDDHDVTDDWFLSADWCRNVLGSQLGHRVVQNAMLAAAVCQLWGNVPTRFAAGTPGAALLDEARAWRGEAGPHADRISSLLGLGTWDEKTKQFDHSKGGLLWHYSVYGPDVQTSAGTGPLYEVLVIDPRTWRTYPGGPSDPPQLLSENGLAAQLGAALPPTVEVTFVVAGTPVVGEHVIERYQGAGTGAARILDLDCETWSFREGFYEELLTRLASRGRVAGGRRQTRVVFLSGDVHYGFASRLRYWDDRPKPENGAGAVPLDAVFAQLTSSAFKNQTPGVKGWFLDHFPRSLNDKFDLEHVFGWNQAGVDAMLQVEVPGRPGPAPIWSASVGPAPFALTTSAADPYRIVGVTREPDRCMRTDFVPSAAGADGSLVLVNHNNLGEVTLSWGETRQVVQKLWWRTATEAVDGQVPLIAPRSVFSVSLDLDDARYPRPTVQVLAP
jgi:hypothetical protein